jgi:hypothetical protein
VSRVVLLDSGPLGLVTNPRLSPKSLECVEWLQGLLARGADVVVPEIADYEVRRELLRAGKAQGLARLDELATALHYLPITSAAMRQAAAFWARLPSRDREVRGHHRRPEGGGRGGEGAEPGEHTMSSSKKADRTP